MATAAGKTTSWMSVMAPDGHKLRIFFLFFFINKLTDVSTHLHSTCGHFCCGSSRCVTKKKEPTAETRRKEEKIVECRQVLMLSDTDVQTFFFPKKITGGFNGRGATCEPGNERMRRTGWPDKKKKQNFLKKFSLTFLVVC